MFMLYIQTDNQYSTVINHSPWLVYSICIQSFSLIGLTAACKKRTVGAGRSISKRIKDVKAFEAGQADRGKKYNPTNLYQRMIN